MNWHIGIWHTKSTHPTSTGLHIKNQQPSTIGADHEVNWLKAALQQTSKCTFASFNFTRTQHQTSPDGNDWQRYTPSYTHTRATLIRKWQRLTTTVRWQADSSIGENIKKLETEAKILFFGHTQKKREENSIAYLINEKKGHQQLNQSLAKRRCYYSRSFSETV